MPHNRIRTQSADSAWGESRYTSGTIPTDRQYTGQINDGATGLYYYNARYYDPALHKFVQADSIVPDPTDPQTLNRFSYVNNNPITYTDPTGHYADQGEAGSECSSAFTWATTTSPILTPTAADAVVKAIEYAPKVYDAGIFIINTICEPCDTVATLYAWTQGDFHPADLASFGTPFNRISARTTASIIEEGGQALARNGDEAANATFNRGTWRKSTVKGAVNEVPRNTEGDMICPTCGDVIPETITIDTRNGPRDRRGYDLDHYPVTWSDRIKNWLSQPSLPTRAEVLDSYNREVRAQCPDCNQGHQWEGIPGEFK